jgi:hypothetical protein
MKMAKAFIHIDWKMTSRDRMKGSVCNFVFDAPKEFVKASSDRSTSTKDSKINEQSTLLYVVAASLFNVACQLSAQSLQGLWMT